LLPILRANASRPDSLVSEILILDSGSTDGTRELALAHGAVWHERTWQGYGPQKKAATRLARNAWILNLDADEVPEPEFWAGLSAYFARGESAAPRAATLERAFVLFGKTLRYGGAGEQRKVRLYHRDTFDWNGAAVHEDVVDAQGNTASGAQRGHVQGAVLHHSWASTSDWLHTTDARAGVLAKEKILTRAGPEGVLGVGFACRLCTRFFLEFARSYVLRGGLFDGVPGFTFCFFMAFSHALKFIKAYEMAVASRDVSALQPGP